MQSRDTHDKIDTQGQGEGVSSNKEEKPVIAIGLSEDEGQSIGACRLQ